MEWIGRAVDAYPDACDVRLHYALAQSWAGRLEPPARAYRTALEACPEQARGARLGLARVLRWQEQFREAETQYRRVAEAAEPEGDLESAIGRGWSALALYEPRGARDLFATAWAADSSRAEAAEGLAHAYLDLGMDGRAGAVLATARRLDLSSPGLHRAEKRRAARSSPGFETAGLRFSDNDGTDFTGGRFTLHLPLASRTDLELTGQRWEVSRSALFSAWSPGARLHHRFEGVPRLTLDWPSRMQLYDRSFPFALWSPERYVETGPGVHLYQSLGGGWGLNLFTRVGIQDETGSEPDGLFVGRGSLEWEFTAGSRLRLQGGWSNSSLGGATGFRRTSVEAGFLWRL